MLMVNPQQECWHVTHPLRDETGRMLVPVGYWRPVDAIHKPWVLRDREGDVVSEHRSYVVACTLAWLLRRSLHHRVQWSSVHRQAAPSVTAYDPECGWYVELPE